MSNALKNAGKRLEIDLDEDAEIPIVAAAQSSVVDLDDDGPSDIIDEDANPLDKLPEAAIRNDDGTITLPLNYPVVLRTKKNGKERERPFKELTFHRLTGADQRAIAAASDDAQALVSFAQSTKISQAVMNALWDRMDMSDIANGGRVLNHFLTSGQKTGR